MRRAASIVAWLLSYTYVVHLVGAFAQPCTQGSDSAYMTSMVLGPLTLVIAACGISRSSRWFLLPHLPLAIVTIVILAHYFTVVTLGGNFICFAQGDVAARCWDEACVASWQRLYAPVYFAALALFATRAARLTIAAPCPTI